MLKKNAFQSLELQCYEREIDEELRMAVKNSFQIVCYKKEPRYKLSTKG